MGRKERIDMTRVRHGRLVGLRYSHTAPNGRAHWVFQCDCGATTVADGGNVRAGTTRSCGCRHRELSAQRLTVHGHRAAKEHGPTYKAWQQMCDACHNPRSPKWAAVGGLGVGVVPAWAGRYETFLAEMGERPPGTRLARRNLEGSFEATNCRWEPVEDRAARARRGWHHRRAASGPVHRGAVPGVGDRAPSGGRSGPAPWGVGPFVFRAESASDSVEGGVFRSIGAMP